MSRLQHEIEGRTAKWAAFQFITIGLALLKGSWGAMAFALILPLGLWCWVHLVEEK